MKPHRGKALLRECEEEVSLEFRAPEIILSSIKPWIVSLSGAINNPHHISVKALACGPFFRFEMRMLKLNHKAMWGTNISDVLFAGLLIVLDKLLAFGREFVFPRAVPLGFLFGPGITIPNSSVRPGVGFNSLTACKCIFHVARPHLESESKR